MDHIRGSDALRRLISVLVGTAAVFSACASASKIRADAEVVKRDIDTARENGAYTCDPKDLAMAESHVRFTLDELDQGNWRRADDHITIATASVKRAIENSPVDRCVPKKPAVAAQKSDRDGDGIPDADDACPDVPGVPELNGCPKPLDTDGDGLTDDIDQCPNDPGPAALHGCPDSDGDGIIDLEDQCPHEPGPADSPQGKGCPRKFTLVTINREKQQIELKDKIYFESAKWKIIPKSFKVWTRLPNYSRTTQPCGCQSKATPTVTVQMSSIKSSPKTERMRSRSTSGSKASGSIGCRPSVSAKANRSPPTVPLAARKPTAAWSSGSSTSSRLTRLNRKDW